MTDKETLILAAKAVGIEFYKKDESGRQYVPEPKYTHGFRDEDAIVWNSFEDNDDCFRLETALGLDISWNHENQYVVSGDNSIEYFRHHNGDKDKARRYASTRAAALRGRD